VRTLTIQVGGETITLDLERGGPGADAVVAQVEGTRIEAKLDRAGNVWRFALADRTVALTVVRDGSDVWVAVEGEIYRCRAGDDPRGAAGGRAPRNPRVTAPMPGRVLEVLVREGQQVAAGDALVTLEAMKMETVASADAAGRVLRVHVTTGAMVEPGQILVELEFD
jgi:biotin carboxyl carrier protein